MKDFTKQINSPKNESYTIKSPKKKSTKHYSKQEESFEKEKLLIQKLKEVTKIISGVYNAQVNIIFLIQDITMNQSKEVNKILQQANRYDCILTKEESSYYSYDKLYQIMEDIRNPMLLAKTNDNCWSKVQIAQIIKGMMNWEQVWKSNIALGKVMKKYQELDILDYVVTNKISLTKEEMHILNHFSINFNQVTEIITKYQQVAPFMNQISCKSILKIIPSVERNKIRDCFKRDAEKNQNIWQKIIEYLKQLKILLQDSSKNRDTLIKMRKRKDQRNEHTKRSC